MTKTIVLTGPIGVGKSTLAKRLGAAFDMPVCVYDEVKAKYRADAGFDKKRALDVCDTDGTYAMMQYMNEFKASTLKQIVEDHLGHIIDLGAGAHAFDEAHQIETARQAFELVDDVILLMPSEDLETCIKSLPGFKQNYEVNTYLIMHPTNQMFATQTVFTHEKSEETVLKEVLSIL